ncbi:hypothetical protein [Flavobacterium sp. ABG]|uniref:hypothetical protein n=1 Tax=Flavobacterium sp. ABG TaxID=1423322 RepID=UPI00064B6E65|nr:hypothetical protein [Flavobacterium sp. ABG]KLT70346.1 hypothetical protein AB674_06630 [Flavobacterium sp. ABG]
MKKNTLLKILIGLVAVLIILVSASFINSHSPAGFKNEMEPQKYVDSVSSSLEDLTIKNREIRNNWNTYFKVSNNKFSYYEIGGIENLQISFTNDSDYVVDNAYVDVCYVIDNGSCYKTESLLFKHVAPHSIVTQDAPNSSRGTNIRLEFSQIYSDKLNFLYGQNIVGTRSSIDPYFSKD